MSQYSAMFASISPGMTVDNATSGLVSTMKAYGMEADQVLDGIMSKVNAVGNGFALTNADVIDGLQRSSSAMAAANNSFDQTVALITAGTEVLQDSQVVGSSLKTISMRLRGYDEETEKLSDDLKTITGDIADLTKTASKPTGISLFTDETRQTYKSTYQILKEVSEIWDELTDKNQAQLLEKMFGKTRAQAGAAILSNFSQAEKALGVMASSAGNAEAEMEVIMNSLEFKINAFKETMTGIWQNLIDRGDISQLVDFGTSILEVFDKITEKIGLLGTIAVGGGAFAGITAIMGAIKNLQAAGSAVTVVSTLSGAFPALANAFSNAASASGLLSGALSALWTIISAHPIMAVVAAAGLLVTAFTYMATSAERANERMASAFEEYEKAHENTQQIYEQLEEIQGQIDSLNAKGGLTLVEKEQLENLNKAKEDMLILADLAEKDEARAAKKAGDAAVEAYNKNFKDAINKERVDDYADDSLMLLLSDESNVSAYLAGIRKLKESRDEALASGDTKGVDNFNKTIDDSTDAMWQQVSALSVYKDKLTELQKYGDLSSEQQATLDAINTAIETIYTELDPQKWHQIKFDELFSDSSFANAKQNLIDFAKASNNAGISIGDLIELEPEMAAAFSSTFGHQGLQELVDYINSQAETLDVDNVRTIIHKRLNDSIESEKVESDVDVKVNPEVEVSDDGKSATAQEIMDWFDNLGEEYQLAYFNLSNNADIDTSGWSLDAYQQWVNAFVNGSQDVSDATTETKSNVQDLAESTSKFVTSVGNVQSALGQQGTGKSTSIDLNAEGMMQYRSALEYVNGTMQLNADKVREIIAAKAEEEKATIATNKAMEQEQYLANAAQIEKYREELRSSTNLSEEQRNAINDSIASLLSENSAIANTCAQYDLMTSSINEATSAYQHWLNAQNATQTGDMFDSSLSAIKHIKDTLTDSTSDSYMRVGNESYKAAIEFVIPDSIDSEDEQAVTSYLESISRYITTDDSGNLKGVNALNFFDDAVEKGLMTFDEASEEYSIAGQKTMQDFADGLNLSLPMVQAIFGELQEFGIKFDWSDEATKTFGDMGVAAHEAAESLREIEGNENLKIAMDVSGFEDTEKAVETLDSTIAEMQGLNTRVGVDSSEVDQANQVIQYCMMQKQMLTNPAVMTVDTSQITGEIGQALAMMQQFKALQNKIDLDASIGADTSEAEAQLNELSGQINSLSDSTKVQVGLTVGENSTEQIQSAIDGLTAEDIVMKIGIDASLVEGYKAGDKEATVKFKADTKAPESYNPSNKNASVVYGVIHSAVDAYNPQNLNRTVTYTYQTIGSPPAGASSTTFVGSGGGHYTVNGTAHAYGTARVGGDWGTAIGGRTLTGELGQEIIVDPRSGKWYTVGDNGAEFVDIPRGAIVFNHKQSESLLKYGYVTGRGTAMASGTAMVTGGTVNRDRLQQISGGSSSGSSGSSNSGGNTGGSGNNGGGTTTKKDTKHDKTKKDTKNVFDYIEVRIDRLERKIKRFKEVTDNIFSTWKTRNKALANQIKTTSKEIDIQNKAIARYKKEADKVDLKEDIKKKIRDGSIKITNYDEKTKKKIDEYKKWYEKILNCRDAIQSLTISLAELSKQQFDNIATKWDNALQNLQHKAERRDALIDRAESYASDYKPINTSTKVAQKNITRYEAQITNAQKQIEKRTKERDALIADLNAKLADPKSGIKKGTEAYYEMLAVIQDVENEIDNLNGQIIDYSNKISEEYMTMFDNIVEKYEGKMSLVSHLANEYSIALDKAEAKGLIATELYYKNMQTIEKSNISLMKNELKALTAAKQQALETGQIAIGSKAYYEMTQQINDLNEQIMKAEVNVIELGNSLREVKWKQFDYAREMVSSLNDEVGFLVKLLDDKKLIDDKGSFTDEGMTTIGLYGTSYNILMSEADKYAEEIKRINSELAKDPNNTTIIARQKELLKAQQDSILSANEQKKAIVSLVEKGIKAELSSMKELIKSYTDALDRQKDLYDFQKKVEEQSKNITSLQKQLAAYENDISEETKSKIQKLKVELENAKEELDKTESDYLISQQKKLLDDLYDEFEKSQNERMDNTDALIEEMINTANKNAVTINDTLQSATAEVGYTMTEEMDSIWSEAAAHAGEIEGAISTYSSDFSSKMTTTNTTLSNIQNSVDALVAAAEAQAQADAARIEQERIERENAEKLAADKAKAAKEEAERQAALEAADAKAKAEMENNKTGSIKVLDSGTTSSNNTKTDANNSNTTTQGDGKVQVGDKVKYESGVYYASSDGSGSSGSSSKGKQVYITKINSGSKLPYHISTGKKLGSGDLGWLKKSQISGYATGLHRASKSHQAWIGERGDEMWISPSRNAVMANIAPDDAVINAMATENLWKMANNPKDFINDNIPMGALSQKSSISNNFDNITFNLPNVKNYEEFLYSMQHDKQFEQLIQSMTTDVISGRKHGKYRFNF